METFSVAKIFILTVLGFVLAIAWTPLLTHYLYKYKAWRKVARKNTLSSGGKELKTFAKLGDEYHVAEVHTPRMGGLLVWVTTLVLIYLIYFLGELTDVDFIKRLNFLSRSDTWLPLFTLVVAGIIGWLDDLLVVLNRGLNLKKGGGIHLKHRLLLVTIIGIIGAWWFHSKLGWDVLHIPFWGDLYINGWYIPLFIVVMVATFSSSVIDGVDGLSGGVFAALFGVFGVIAFLRGQVDLATFCAVICGTLFAFLWFNIPPARFYMTESGVLPLTTTLTVVAFLTNSVFILPVAGVLLVATTLSDIIQIGYDKINGGKIFLAAPLHHHFQVKGWPDAKVSMRYWVVAVMAAMAGLALYLLDKGL